ncbi:MAG: cytochrome c family protein [Sedimentitalea sp.]|nr:cytochrome c family protein [Sedimentitalea sp.]
MFKTILGAATVLAIAALPALADGDAEKGEKVFKKCKACHDVGEGAKNKVGPELNDVMGRTAGTVADFGYSDAMVEAGAGGLVWDEESLEEYLKKPKDFIPGNKMSFAGLRKDDEIADLIAYLKTFAPQ